MTTEELQALASRAHAAAMEIVRASDTESRSAAEERCAAIETELLSRLSNRRTADWDSRTLLRDTISLVDDAITYAEARRQLVTP